MSEFGERRMSEIIVFVCVIAVIAAIFAIGE